MPSRWAGRWSTPSSPRCRRTPGSSFPGTPASRSSRRSAPAGSDRGRAGRASPGDRFSCFSSPRRGEDGARSASGEGLSEPELKLRAPLTRLAALATLSPAGRGQKKRLRRGGRGARAIRGGRDQEGSDDGDAAVAVALAAILERALDRALLR